jgi:hypothetical protein
VDQFNSSSFWQADTSQSRTLRRRDGDLETKGKKIKTRTEVTAQLGTNYLSKSAIFQFSAK